MKRARNLSPLLALIGFFSVSAIASTTTFPNTTALWSMDQIADFGRQVAAAPNIVAVLDGDAVFVYQKLGGTWTETAKLTESDASTLNEYPPLATSLAMSTTGNTIAIGVDSGSLASGTLSPGYIYVFDKPSSGWHDMTETARLSADPSAGCRVGDSVALDDTYVVTPFLIGCNGSPTGWAVAAFTRPASGWIDSTLPQTITYNYVGNELSDESGLEVSSGVAAACTGNTAYPSDNVASVLALDPSISSFTSANIAPPPGFVPENWCTVMALNSDSIALSDLGFGSGSIPQGVFVFTEPGTGWATTNTPTAILSPANSADTLGSLLAISANLIVASDLSANHLYVFEKPVGGWADANETLGIDLPSPNTGSTSPMSLATTDTFITAGEAIENCPTEKLKTEFNYCQLVYVLDSGSTIPGADPIVDLAMNTRAAIINKPFSITTTVTNQSTLVQANSVEVNFPIPANLSNVQFNSSQGTCQLQSGSATCALGVLPASGSATITLSATAPQKSETGTQSATVSTSSPVRSLRDHTASIDYIVDTPPVAKTTTMSVDPGTAYPVNFNASDVDQNKLTYRIVKQPQHGRILSLGTTVVNGYAPVYQYATLNKTYSGSDSFTYVANDGYTDSNVATVGITINPVKKAPTKGKGATGLLSLLLLGLCAGLGYVGKDTVGTGFD